MPIAETKIRLALKNILFTTDFSDASNTALPFMAALARRYSSNVVVLNVVEEVPVTTVPMDTMPPDFERDREKINKKMSTLLDAEVLGGLKVEPVVEPGFIWPIVSKLIEERQVDLVVLGTHGRGAFKRLILGSVAEQICRHAQCPVMTIGPHVRPVSDDYTRIDRILFATDFSSGSLHALQFALKLADEHEAKLYLLHVVQPPGVPLDVTDQLIAESEVKLRSLITPQDMPTKRPEFVTLVGVPANQILSLASRETVNLIVMGMHKGTALASHWPFEVASQIVAGAMCPVMSVRT